MNVKIFVKCEPSRLENTLDVLRNKGLDVECLSKSQPGVVIGTIDENKIPELRNTDGVLGVSKNQQFEPLN